MSYFNMNQYAQLHLHPPQPSLVKSPAPASSSQQPEPQLPTQPEQQFPKNRLQEFTQKLKIPLPLYETVNVGSKHLIRFKSTVIVDGKKFASPNTFPTRKAAEKDIAELALKHVSQRKIEEDVPQEISLSPEEIVSYKYILNESGLACYKSILNEFAIKTGMENPTYNTDMHEGLVPVFISSLVFNGASYTGSAGKNKKEAEQFAARAVVMSLLDIPKMEKVLIDVINSKIKPYAALQNISIPSSTTALPINTTHVPSNVPAKVIGAPITVDTHSTIGSNTAASVVPVANVPPIHRFSIQNPDKSIQATNLVEPAYSEVPRLPIEFVHPVLPVLGDTGLSTSKKRRKNKKKANKRLCTGDTGLPVANVALDQAPRCSTAQ